MNKYILSTISNLLLVSAAYSSSPAALVPELTESGSEPNRPASLFPQHFTNEDMAVLANDQGMNQVTKEFTIYSIHPDSKDTFKSFYNTGSFRRWWNNGPAAYFALKEVEQSGRFATYAFSGAYYGATEVQVELRYNYFKSLDPTKCVVKDMALSLFQVWQFDASMVGDKIDNRYNVTLAMMCYLRDTYTSNPDALTTDSDKVKRKKGRNAFIKELENDKVDQDTLSKLRLRENAGLDISIIQSLNRRIKAQLYKAIGVNPDVLDNQIKTIGEYNLQREFIELQMKLGNS